MASAICPHCNEPAFSSAEFNRPWTCPTCNRLVIPMATDGQRKPMSLGKDSVIDQYSKYWTHE